MNLLVSPEVIEGLDALDTGLRLQVAGEVARARALSSLARAYRIDEDAAGAGVERLVRGGADGTPLIGEFLALEVAARLGVSAASAALEIAAVLNLEYRHPGLWSRVLSGEIRFWQAREVASECRHLSVDAAAWVDAQLEIALAMVPWSRAKRLLAGLIVQADSALAAERAAAAASGLGVHVGEVADGTCELWGRLSARDGLFFDAQIARIADLLAEQGDEGSLSERRARAVGVLATPALATAMLQQAALAEGAAVQPAFDDSDADPTPCHGHLCGRIDVDPDRLLPPATLVVHTTPDALADGTGAARVEGVGPVPIERLHDLLGHTRVTVRPVIDLADAPACDRYEIPRRLRETLIRTNPVEVAPWGVLPSGRCDLDHQVPWSPSAFDGAAQTRLDNLAPLSRRWHRAKTHAGWRLTQYTLGRWEWQSPSGIRLRTGPKGTRRVPWWHERELESSSTKQPPGAAPAGTTEAPLTGRILDPPGSSGVRLDLCWPPG